MALWLEQLFCGALQGTPVSFELASSNAPCVVNRVSSANDYIVSRSLSQFAAWRALYFSK